MIKASPLQVLAYRHLREMIDANNLQDGIIYSETKIAEEIGVSRTPMRDALMRLESEGFIEILPSRGFQLKPITPEHIKNNSQVRSALEGYSALMLTNNRNTEVGQNYIKQLGALIEKQRLIYESACGSDEFVKSDSEFHLTMVESLQNRELLKIFQSHLYYIQKLARKSLAYPGRLRDTLNEHTAIYEAIRQGDTANVYSITMLHMRNAVEINLADISSADQIR